jgi:hypothetical protein
LSATPSHARNARQPSILVLCDDDVLHQVIALSLRGYALEVAPLCACRQRTTDDGRPTMDRTVSRPSPIVRRPSSPAPDPASGRYDLIVLALGASRAEPLVALNRAALLECVGATPLLVISRRAFEADPGAGIYHLAFPFDAHDLSREVKRLVGG